MNGGIEFFQLPVNGAGTPYVECLSSYIGRLARAHRIPTQSLLTLLGGLTGHSFAKTKDLLRGSGGRTLNHYTETQAEIRTALARALGHAGFEETTLCDFSSVFANQGTGALKPEKHWCALCYEERTKSDEDPVDLLIWQMPELRFCPTHRVELHAHCTECRETQPFLTRRGCLDACQSCGALLWHPNSHKSLQDSTPEDKGYQEWLIKHLPELLQARSDLRPFLTGRECGLFLRSVAGARRLSVEAFAKKIRVPSQTLANWIRGRSKPKLETWLRVCAQIDISPCSPLRDPIEAARQMPFELAAPSIFVPSRKPPIIRHDKDAVRAALLAELEQEEPKYQSVNAFAREIGVDPSTLYSIAKQEAREYAARIKASREARLKKSEEELREAAIAAIAALIRRREPLTRKRFVGQLREQVSCTEHRAKNEFGRVMEGVRGKKN